MALWMREWRVRGLLDLIESLPHHSRFMSAVLNDEEAAPMLIKQAREREAERGKVDWRPDVSEWGLSLEILAQVRDAVFALGSPSDKTPDSFPRPETAVDRERRQTEAAHKEANTLDIVSQLTPWAVGQL